MSVDLEKRAILETMQSLLNKQVAEIKRVTDRQINEEYLKEGTRGHDVFVNGLKVGTSSPSFSREKREIVCTLSDRDAFESWVKENPEMVAKWLMDSGFATNMAEAIAKGGTGELVSGITEQEIITTAALKPTPNFKADEQKVIEAIRPMLHPAVTELLLGGGDEH